MSGNTSGEYQDQCSFFSSFLLLGIAHYLGTYLAFLFIIEYAMPF